MRSLKQIPPLREGHRVGTWRTGRDYVESARQESQRAVMNAQKSLTILVAEGDVGINSGSTNAAGGNITTGTKVAFTASEAA